MEPEQHNPATTLKQLVADGRFSEDALQTITHIEPKKLEPFQRNASSEAAIAGGLDIMTAEECILSDDEATRLSILTSQLAEGMKNDDVRLTAILESLIGECHLTLSNIALLTDTSSADLEIALHNPQKLGAEMKFHLGIRASYLLNATNLARPRALPECGSCS